MCTRRALALVIVLAASAQAHWNYNVVEFSYAHPTRFTWVPSNGESGFEARNTRTQQDPGVIFGGDCYHWTLNLAPFPFLEARVFEDWQEPHTIAEGGDHWGAKLDQVFEYQPNTTEYNTEDHTVILAPFDPALDKVTRRVKLDVPSQWTPLTREVMDTFVTKFSSSYHAGNDEFLLEVFITEKAAYRADHDVVVPNMARVDFSVVRWNGTAQGGTGRLALRSTIVTKAGTTPDLISDVTYHPDRNLDPLLKPHIRVGALPYEGIFAWEHDTSMFTNGKYSKGGAIEHTLQPPEHDGYDGPLITAPAHFGAVGPIKELYLTFMSEAGHSALADPLTKAQVQMFMGFVEQERPFPNAYKPDTYLVYLLVAGGFGVCGLCVVYTCVVKGVFDHIKVVTPDGVRIKPNPERERIRVGSDFKNYTKVQNSDRAEGPGPGEPAAV